MRPTKESGTKPKPQQKVKDLIAAQAPPPIPSLTPGGRHTFTGGSLRRKEKKRNGETWKEEKLSFVRVGTFSM
jgi:hypothetical protein